MNIDFIKDQFPDLAKDQKLIEEIAQVATIKSYNKGEVIIDYGDYIKYVPMVISGLLKIIREGENDNEILLYFLGSGESCAASFSCCMIKKRSEIKAVCEEKSKILMIPISYADQWMGQYSNWRDFVINMYDARLLSLIDTIDRVSFAKLDEKLLYYLDEMVSHKSDQVLNISHHEIALDLNASRESISRLLKKLEAAGKISLSRNEITIIDL